MECANGLAKARADEQSLRYQEPDRVPVSGFFWAVS
jgi:hypothetical protein